MVILDALYQPDKDIIVLKGNGSILDSQGYVVDGYSVTCKFNDYEDEIRCQTNIDPMALIDCVRTLDERSFHEYAEYASRLRYMVAPDVLLTITVALQNLFYENRQILLKHPGSDWAQDNLASRLYAPQGPWRHIPNKEYFDFGICAEMMIPRRKQSPDTLVQMIEKLAEHPYLVGSKLISNVNVGPDIDTK